MTREADSPRIARICSRGLVTAGLVGALALSGMATAVAVARTHTATQTVLTAYKGKRGSELVVVMNGQKLPLFNFSADPPNKSTCYSQKQKGVKEPCDKVWYPLILHGKVVVKQSSSSSAHINTAQLKTTKRKDGSVQITYYKQPLYRCHRDTKTGQVYGTDAYEFGGSWGLMGTPGSPLSAAGYGGGKQVPGC